MWKLQKDQDVKVLENPIKREAIVKKEAPVKEGRSSMLVRDRSVLTKPFS